MTLNDFLGHKPLFYDVIDYDRFPRIYNKIKEYLPCPKTLHVIGTNGKGTTGRFIASALLAKGFKVGHYTSPHILKFNERIWLNGSDMNDESLESAHKKLYALLQKEDADALSYFEYTTLLAFIAFSGCDYVVLEAGLGGEHDATAVFPNELTVVTPIGFDHQAFLGDTIESIARTKLRAAQKKMVVGLQKYDEVYTVAQEVARQKNIQTFFIKDMNFSLMEKTAIIAHSLHVKGYLEQNLQLAIAALSELGFDAKAEDFKDARLFGRLTKIASNIYLDVGHNPLAAEVIAESLKGRKFTLIYNTYKDKDYRSVLSILKPIIETIEIINVQDARIVEKEVLKSFIKELGIPCKEYKTIQEDKEYLVFGSFSVAERFLKG